MRAVLLAGWVWTGCVSTAPTGSEAAPDPDLDPRTQYDLIVDIRRAEASRSTAEFNAVRASWQGRRLQWEGLHVPALCRTADPCHLVPFDHARIEGIVRQGWLPRLTLDADDARALDALCADHEPCVVTYEGTLGVFRFSADHPTELGFSDVAFVTARAPAEGESWGRRFVPGRGDLDAVRARGEALRAQGYVPTLRTPEG